MWLRHAMMLERHTEVGPAHRTEENLNTNRFTTHKCLCVEDNTVPLSTVEAKAKIPTEDICIIPFASLSLIQSFSIKRSKTLADSDQPHLFFNTLYIPLYLFFRSSIIVSVFSSPISELVTLFLVNDRLFVFFL